MIEYKVYWQQQPHNYNTLNVLFVKAETPKDAEAIAKDHIQRKYGVVNFTINPHPYETEAAKPVPAGCVIGEN